jgi:hypothetical protein
VTFTPLVLLVFPTSVDNVALKVTFEVAFHAASVVVIPGRTRMKLSARACSSRSATSTLLTVGANVGAAVSGVGAGVAAPLISTTTITEGNFVLFVPFVKLFIVLVLLAPSTNANEEDTLSMST